MNRYAILAAASIALATPGFAQENTTVNSNSTYYTETDKADFTASDLIGSRIYATEAAVNTDDSLAKAGDDWDDIGEINNLIVGRDGSVKAVVVGVGGFLGLGEKNVALRMSELRFVKKSGDDANDYFVVVKSNKEQLEKAPEYKLPE
jgi:hypothetical protein